jgi:hypothetical protein
MPKGGVDALRRLDNPVSLVGLAARSRLQTLIQIVNARQQHEEAAGFCAARRCARGSINGRFFA